MIFNCGKDLLTTDWAWTNMYHTTHLNVKWGIILQLRGFLCVSDLFRNWFLCIVRQKLDYFSRASTTFSCLNNGGKDQNSPEGTVDHLLYSLLWPDNNEWSKYYRLAFCGSEFLIWYFEKCIPKRGSQGISSGFTDGSHINSLSCDIFYIYFFL